MVGHFLLLVLLSLVISSLCETLLAPTKQPKVCASQAGCMEGKYMPGFHTERFEAYLGIPYALPPVDELRFKSPKAYPRWSHVMDATVPKMDCIQKNYLLPNPVVYGTEDCLYLNVYRPEIRPKQLLPVMVYIHGGGWFSGSASPVIHGPEYIMDTQEVILVTFAYRLGALGFLSTNDQHIPGNFGLKDQNLLLRWVQQNIASFGGNPKMVTLFGQSAGAISAHMHMLSKQSEGLFRGIIALSGTANVPFAITENPLLQARKVAQLCNISDADNLTTAELSRALRAVDAPTLVNSGDGLKYWDVDHMTNFRPVIESTEVVDAFFTQHPERILRAGQYKAVPWMAGVVPQEGAVRVLSILANERLRGNFDSRFDELLEALMELPKKFTRSQLDEKMALVIDEYFGGEHELNNVTAAGFLDVSLAVTDRGFHQPFFNAIEIYVNTINTEINPVYLHKFNYKGPYSFASIYTGAELDEKDHGVVHCDDLIYFFRAPLLFPDFEKNSTHAKMAKTFVEHLVHFAKHRKPKNADAMRPCDRHTFNSKPNAICDYLEFVNSGTNSFEIKTENKYNVKRVHLWNQILESGSLL